MLPGYKTYAVAAAMVVLSGLYGQGYLNEGTYKTLEGLLLGGGLAALRAGIAKVSN